MGKYSNRIKAQAAEREYGYRQRVYVRLVDQGKMKASTATTQIAIMKEIADEYGALADAEEAGERLL